MGLFRFLLILALVYYIFKFLSPFIKKFFLRKLGERLEKQMHDKFKQPGGEQRQRTPNSNDKRKEGEVKVEKLKQNTKSKKVNTDNLGDYVDYEEVKE